MRFLVILALFSLICFGCGGKKARPGSGKAAGAEVLGNPAGALVGKVVSVNVTARFVVLSFPVGRLPSLEQRLSVYRQGVKVGEVKITGPQRDDNIAADTIAGEPALGDQVRQQ
jgi:hypothetical protein